MWVTTHLLTIDTNFPRDIQVAVFYPTAILANLDTDTSTLFKSVQPSWQKGGPEMRLSAVEAEPVQMKAKRQWCFLMIPWHLLKTCNKNRISKHLKKGSRQRKRNPSQLSKDPTAAWRTSIIKFTTAACGIETPHSTGGVGCTTLHALVFGRQDLGPKC